MQPEIGPTVATDDAAKHERALRSCIRTAIRDGTGELHEILRRCEGADPVFVARLFAEIAGQPLSEPSVSVPAYEALSTLSRLLPAPDPSRSQWWFSSAGLTYFSSLIETRAGLFESPRIFCLGTPTLGPHLAHRNFKVDILDIDEQVLDALQPLDQSAARHKYDAADAIPPPLSNSCQIAVLDPPWYRPEIYTFVNRALESLVVEGEFFCTLPGRLTRPGVETLRTELVRDLAAAGHEVLALERVNSIPSPAL
jgi:dGTPase